MSDLGITLMSLIRRKPRAKRNDGAVIVNAVSDPGLEEIAAWETWFRNAHEEILRDYPDKHLVEQKRAEIDRLATAITQERITAYLARRS
jgi:hypothetical protein